MTYTTQVGPIPEWIKDLRAKTFCNPFEIVDAPTIYGTEHFLGDWSGSMLILAQDFAPASKLRALAAKGLPPATVYRHSDGDDRFGQSGLATNKAIASAFFGDTAYIDGRAAKNCGAVYGSVCFFLKSGESMSGNMSGFRPGTDVFDGSIQVLRHVVQSMPNLKAILLLGQHAAKAASTLRAINPKLTVRSTFHPAARGITEKRAFATALRGMCRELQIGIGQ